jgi:hypothetical protein
MKWAADAKVGTEKAYQRSLDAPHNRALMRRVLGGVSRIAGRRGLERWRLAVQRGRRGELETQVAALKTQLEATRVELEATRRREVRARARRKSQTGGANSFRAQGLLKSTNENLGQGIVSAENVAHDNKVARIKKQVECGLVKANQILCCKRVLPLIWGSEASGRVGSLMKALGGHSLAEAFRRWEVVSRASAWAEHAQKHGLAENLSWHNERAGKLSEQLAAVQTVAEEKKWAADVMAKQVVKGTEENSRCAERPSERERQRRK